MVEGNVPRGKAVLAAVHMMNKGNLNINGEAR